MFRIISLAIILVAAIVDASQYYYAPLGPWGLESSIVNVKAIRKGDNDLNKVKTTSRKTGTDKDKVKEVKSDFGDELEEAEEAFLHAVEHVEETVLHAVEHVEETVVHAIDDEVETFFPHHKKTEKE